MPISDVLIRDIEPRDRDGWAVLWQAYLEFYQVPGLAPEITARSWARFFDAAEPVHAMVAAQNGRVVGLVHYIFHRSTWFLEDVCYLQDLFTEAGMRGKGIARALIEAVYARAQARGAKRVCWMTHESNTQAMLLYDQLAAKPGFVQYRKDF